MCHELFLECKQTGSLAQDLVVKVSYIMATCSYKSFLKVS